MIFISAESKVDKNLKDNYKKRKLNKKFRIFDNNCSKEKIKEENSQNKSNLFQKCFFRFVTFEFVDREFNLHNFIRFLLKNSRL